LYAVHTLDEAIPLLSGLQAGGRDASGAYPDGTFNALVEKRLRDFMRGRQEFTHEALAAGTLQKR
jgi:hypothetical protein